MKWNFPTHFSINSEKSIANKHILILNPKVFILEEHKQKATTYWTDGWAKVL
jgi:hypothetical protein